MPQGDGVAADSEESCSGRCGSCGELTGHVGIGVMVGVQEVSAERMAYRRESVSSHAQKKVIETVTLPLQFDLSAPAPTLPSSFLKPALHLLTRRRELDAPGPGF